MTEKTKRRIVIMGSNPSIQGFFEEFGDLLLFAPGAEVPEDMITSSDLLVLTGGPDINPEMYDNSEGEHRLTFCHGYKRDEVESDAYMVAVANGVPVVGICRGAQLVCACAGGKVIQHVQGHATRHEVQLWDYKKNAFVETICSSTHHQMMFPFNMNIEDYCILGKSAARLSKVYERGPNAAPYTDKEVPVEPEVVYFPYVESLAIQGHPEYDTSKQEFVQYCKDLIAQHMKLAVQVPEYHTKEIIKQAKK